MQGLLPFLMCSEALSEELGSTTQPISQGMLGLARSKHGICGIFMGVPYQRRPLLRVVTLHASNGGEERKNQALGGVFFRSQDTRGIAVFHESIFLEREKLPTDLGLNF